jgi:hypothetical protein
LSKLSRGSKSKSQVNDNNNNDDDGDAVHIIGRSTVDVSLGALLRRSSEAVRCDPKNWSKAARK